MTGPAKYPLRLLVTNQSERFQLHFAEECTVLLTGFAGVRAQASARGLILEAVAERDLVAAAALVQGALPAAHVGPLEVVYLNQGDMEPYVRLRIATPAECYERVLVLLDGRHAVIETLDDAAGLKLVWAAARVAAMLGFDADLGAASAHRATVDYEFSDYRPVGPRKT
jgi:hypothetical protein